MPLPTSVCKLGRVLADTARFRPEDPDALVHASVACPFCLREDEVDVSPALEGYDPSVQCLCRCCHEGWRVYMTPEQSLRFGLMLAHA